MPFLTLTLCFIVTESHDMSMLLIGPKGAKACLMVSSPSSQYMEPTQTRHMMARARCRCAATCQPRKTTHDKHQRVKERKTNTHTHTLIINVYFLLSLLSPKIVKSPIPSQGVWTGKQGNNGILQSMNSVEKNTNMYNSYKMLMSPFVITV